VVVLFNGEREMVDFSALDSASLPAYWKRFRESLLFYDVLTGLPKTLLPSHSKVGRDRVVFLLPGFGTTTSAMWGLARVLQNQGFDVRDWGLGRNSGQVPALLESFSNRLRDHVDQTGEPAILVGWSLGGYLARETARDLPELVTQIVTLGTPVVGGPKYTIVSEYYKKRGHSVDHIEVETKKRFDVQLETPVTAIFSQYDGVVAWEACIDHWSKQVKHIEVDCTHLGMGFNPKVIHHVVEALAD
jgi:esterase/lipase